jgi:hypothetical protein
VVLASATGKLAAFPQERPVISLSACLDPSRPGSGWRPGR